MLTTDLKKYPSEILEGVKMTLRKELAGMHSNIELDGQIEVMTKVEIMDKYIDSFRKKISSSVICRVMNSIFGFDLDSIPVLSKVAESFVTSEKPLARVVIDSYLEEYGKGITGAEIRGMINQIFGINLDAITALEGARISIYSKNQWVIQHEHDLFVVQTGTGDIDVKVFPTKYFTEQTGLKEVPNDLHHSLTRMGFSYHEKIGSYYFLNPTGEAIPDAFKGQTIGAIIEVIRHSYSNL
jgi:hypothetical protein